MTLNVCLGRQFTGGQLYFAGVRFVTVYRLLSMVYNNNVVLCEDTSVGHIV